MDQTQHALPARTRANVIVRRNARRTDRMARMHHAKQAHGHGKGPRTTRRRVRATAAAAGAFGLVLLAAPCDAQTIPAAVAEASVSSLLGSPGATGAFFTVRRSVDDIPAMTTGHTMRHTRAIRGEDRGGRVCRASMAHVRCPMSHVLLSFSPCESMSVGANRQSTIRCAWKAILNTRGGVMNTQRNLYSIHHVVEFVPGVWKRARLASRSSGNNATFKEAACPTCLQVAREAFQRQFPALCTSATPLTKKSAEWPSRSNEMTTLPIRPYTASQEVFHADHASPRVRHLHCVSRHSPLPLGAVAGHGIWGRPAVRDDHSGTQGDGATCDHRCAERAPGCLSERRGHAPGHGRRVLTQQRG
jgi:hypothetical protein